MAKARSFSLAAADAPALLRPLAESHAGVERPSMGLVFLTGAIAQRIDDVAATVARAWPGVPTVIAAGAGVLSERGELEGQSAAAGLLCSGRQARPLLAEAGSPEELGDALSLELARTTEGRAATALVFARPQLWMPDTLDALADAFPRLSLVGGGTLADPAPVVIDAGGGIASGAVAGLVLGGAPPLIGVSPGCRLLGGTLHTVTDSRGSMVLTLDDKPALEVLSAAAERLEGRPLVLALVPDPDAPADLVKSAPLRSGRLRPIRGVDPARKAVVVGENLAKGSRLGFAALDGAAARADLDAVSRELARELRGSAASFGVYVSCAGRGVSLYGTSDVDAKILRARFEKLPFAGLMSSFEIAPLRGKPRMHFYTGVFGLFTAPS